MHSKHRILCIVQRHSNKYIIWLYQFFNCMKPFIIVSTYGLRFGCAQIAFITQNEMSSCVVRILKMVCSYGKEKQSIYINCVNVKREANARAAPTISTEETAHSWDKRREERERERTGQKNPIKTIKFVIYYNFFIQLTHYGKQRRLLHAPRNSASETRVKFYEFVWIYCLFFAFMDW